MPAQQRVSCCSPVDASRSVLLHPSRTQLNHMAAAQPMINTPDQGPTCILYVYGIWCWDGAIPVALATATSDKINMMSEVAAAQKNL